MALSQNLRQDVIRLLEEYSEPCKVKFPWPLTPPGCTKKPLGITFSDGSEHVYGSVMYLKWNPDQGPIIRLVELKAKLTPLDYGDAVKAEMCGPVFVTWLKKYFVQHSQIEVSRWFHFVNTNNHWSSSTRKLWLSNFSYKHSGLVLDSCFTKNC